MKIELGKFKLDLVLVFLFISPIFYALDYSRMDQVNPDISFQQYQFFILAASLLLAVSVKNKWAGAFLTLATVSAAFQATKDPYSYLALIPIVFAILFYDVIVRCYKKSVKSVVWVSAALLILNLFFAYLQSQKIDLYFLQTNMQPTGLMLLPSYLGQYAAITAPILLMASRWLLLLPYACVLISKSTFCVIALLIAIFAYFAPRMNKKMIWASVVICVVLVALYGHSDKRYGQWERRVNVWKMVFSKAMRSPFVGHGLGSYDKTMFLEFRGQKIGTRWLQINVKPENEMIFKKKIVELATENDTDWSRLASVHFKAPGAPFTNFRQCMDELRGKEINNLEAWVWNQPHNEFLRLFYEFGLAGIFLMAGFIFEVLRKVNWYSRERTALACGFIALLVLACVHFPFYLPCISGTAIVLLGMLERKP